MKWNWKRMLLLVCCGSVVLGQLNEVKLFMMLSFKIRNGFWRTLENENSFKLNVFTLKGIIKKFYDCTFYNIDNLVSWLGAEFMFYIFLKNDIHVNVSISYCTKFLYEKLLFSYSPILKLVIRVFGSRHLKMNKLKFTADIKIQENITFILDLVIIIVGTLLCNVTN